MSHFKQQDSNTNQFKPIQSQNRQRSPGLSAQQNYPNYQQQQQIQSYVQQNLQQQNMMLQQNVNQSIEPSQSILQGSVPSYNQLNQWINQPFLNQINQQQLNQNMIQNNTVQSKQNNFQTYPINVQTTQGNGCNQIRQNQVGATGNFLNQYNQNYNMNIMNNNYPNNNMNNNNNVNQQQIAQISQNYYNPQDNFNQAACQQDNYNNYQYQMQNPQSNNQQNNQQNFQNIQNSQCQPNQIPSQPPYQNLVGQQQYQQNSQPQLTQLTSNNINQQQTNTQPQLQQQYSNISSSSSQYQRQNYQQSNNINTQNNNQNQQSYIHNQNSVVQQQPTNQVIQKPQFRTFSQKPKNNKDVSYDKLTSSQIKTPQINDRHNQLQLPIKNVSPKNNMNGSKVKEASQQQKNQLTKQADIEKQNQPNKKANQIKAENDQKEYQEMHYQPQDLFPLKDLKADDKIIERISRQIFDDNVYQSILSLKQEIEKKKIQGINSFQKIKDSYNYCVEEFTQLIKDKFMNKLFDQKEIIDQINKLPFEMQRHFNDELKVIHSVILNGLFDENRCQFNIQINELQIEKCLLIFLKVPKESSIIDALTLKASFFKTLTSKEIQKIGRSVKSDDRNKIWMNFKTVIEKIAQNLLTKIHKKFDDNYSNENNEENYLEKKYQKQKEILKKLINQFINIYKTQKSEQNQLLGLTIYRKIYIQQKELNGILEDSQSELNQIVENAIFKDKSFLQVGSSNRLDNISLYFETYLKNDIKETIQTLLEKDDIFIELSKCRFDQNQANNYFKDKIVQTFFNEIFLSSKVLEDNQFFNDNDDTHINILIAKFFKKSNMTDIFKSAFSNKFQYDSIYNQLEENQKMYYLQYILQNIQLHFGAIQDLLSKKQHGQNLDQYFNSPCETPLLKPHFVNQMPFNLKENSVYFRVSQSFQVIELNIRFKEQQEDNIFHLDLMSKVLLQNQEKLAQDLKEAIEDFEIEKKSLINQICLNYMSQNLGLIAMYLVEKQNYFIKLINQQNQSQSKFDKIIKYISKSKQQMNDSNCINSIQFPTFLNRINIFYDYSKKIKELLIQSKSQQYDTECEEYDKDQIFMQFLGKKAPKLYNQGFIHVFLDKSRIPAKVIYQSKNKPEMLSFVPISPEIEDYVKDAKIQYLEIQFTSIFEKVTLFNELSELLQADANFRIFFYYRLLSVVKREYFYQKYCIFNQDFISKFLQYLKLNQNDYENMSLKQLNKDKQNILLPGMGLDYENNEIDYEKQKEEIKDESKPIIINENENLNKLDNQQYNKFLKNINQNDQSFSEIQENGKKELDQNQFNRNQEQIQNPKQLTDIESNYQYSNQQLDSSLNKQNQNQIMQSNLNEPQQYNYSKQQNDNQQSKEQQLQKEYLQQSLQQYKESQQKEKQLQLNEQQKYEQQQQQQQIKQKYYQTDTFNGKIIKEEKINRMQYPQIMEADHLVQFGYIQGVRGNKYGDKCIEKEQLNPKSASSFLYYIDKYNLQFIIFYDKQYYHFSQKEVILSQIKNYDIKQIIIKNTYPTDILVSHDNLIQMFEVLLWLITQKKENLNKIMTMKDSQYNKEIDHDIFQIHKQHIWMKIYFKNNYTKNYFSSIFKYDYLDLANKYTPLNIFKEIIKSGQIFKFNIIMENKTPKGLIIEKVTTNLAREMVCLNYDISSLIPTKNRYKEMKEIRILKFDNEKEFDFIYTYSLPYFIRHKIDLQLPLIEIIKAYTDALKSDFSFCIEYIH